MDVDLECCCDSRMSRLYCMSTYMCYLDLTTSVSSYCTVFFFQAEDGIRDLVRSRGLGDVYKRQF
mgnify:CR=1 FL=1